MSSRKLETSEEENNVALIETEKNESSRQKPISRAKIDQVGILSFISFAWIFEYLWAAYKGKVESGRSWPCSIFDSADINTVRLEHLWNDQLKKKPGKPSLFRAIFHFMKYRLFIACCIFFLCLMFGFIGPTCLVKGLISYTESPPKINDSLDYGTGFYLVFGILSVEICRVLMYGATWAISYRTAIRVRGAVISLLFKSLISSKSLRKLNSAEIVNICANDGQRLFDAVTFSPLVLMGPFVIVGGIIYLTKTIGALSLLGLAVFLIFDLIQVFLGLTLVHCRKMAVLNTEKRMHLMGEILKSIRFIKMCSWESLFMQKVIELREEETAFLRKAGYAQSLAIASGAIVPVVATIVTVVSVVLAGNDLLASDAFSAITVFFVMLFGIRMIPYGARYLGEAYTAIMKIEKLLLFDKFDLNLALEPHTASAVSIKNAKFVWDAFEKAVEQLDETVVKNGTGKEDGDAENVESETQKKISILQRLRCFRKQKPDVGTDLEKEKLETPAPKICLNAIDLVVERKERIGICGPVGSGKSALLKSIMGVTTIEEGSISVSGNIAYAGQTPCIFSGSIRDNILFGQQMNSSRYEKAIACSQLHHDLESMPQNEMSDVGERGSALSGGQKSRIALARCFFANREIYLLDEIFSAVNKEIANKIFTDGICELLSSKTVLIVTSNPEYLAKCDRVVFMSSGSVSEIDSHANLMDHNEQYRTFFQEHVIPEVVEDNKIYTAIKPANGDIQHEIGAEETEKLMEEEEDLGLKSISCDVYKEYIKAAGGYVLFGLIVLIFVANVFCAIFSTLWLSKWMKDVHRDKAMPLEKGAEAHYGVRSLANSEDMSFYLQIYGAAMVALFVTGLFKAAAFVKISIGASTRLHNRMLSSVMHGAVEFFDTTPTGRILNRFSKDLDEIDVKLPFSSEALIQYVITTVGFLLTIIWVFPVFIFACLPLSAIFILFFVCFRVGIRSLKRAENVSRSPLFDHISSSLDGLTTIHSFGQNGRFIETLKSRLDEHTSAMFMFHSAMRWQAVWLDLLVVVVSFIVSLLIVLLSESIAPSDAGMALAFALQLSGIFQFAVRSQTDLEAKMTSVERISHYYKNIEQEPHFDGDAPNEWPKTGSVDFNNVVLRYRKGNVAALNGVDFHIADGERVAITGRTGAGKTSITNALYRLYPIESGTIRIDGIDIKTVELRSLRRSMSIIPQDSVLFTGSLRFNLDPEDEYTDEKLWECLERVGLKNFVSSTAEKLSLRIEDAGRNLSSGQRELVCLARTLVRNTRIVIMDEATSSLDAKTDALIQRVIAETFAQHTVLLISHRTENITGVEKRLHVADGKVSIESERSLSKKSTENRPEEQDD